MDRLLCYEVTGIKLDVDDFASDSDDSDDSDLYHDDGDGDGLLLDSPSRGVGIPSKKAKLRRIGKADLQAIDELLTALTQDDDASKGRQKATKKKALVLKSNSINN